MEAFIREVQEFISGETKLQQGGLAKLCNVSTATISQFLAGKYAGDNDRMRTRIIAAIDLYREQTSLAKPSEYVRTDQSKVIEHTITYALKHRQSAAVLADTGIGKTMAVSQVAKEQYGVVHVACNVNDYRQAAFLARLADAIGMRDQRDRTVWMLQAQLEKRLTDSPWCLVIDDAHYLISPSRPLRSISLDVVKDLQAKCGTPFVLLGVPELWQTIAARVHGDWYAQLKRRIGAVQVLHRESIQADDVEAVTRSLGASRPTQSVLQALTALARQPGAYGNVEKAVRWSMRDGGRTITADELKRFLAMTSNSLLRVPAEPSPDQVKAMEKDAAAVA